MSKRTAAIRKHHSSLSKGLSAARYTSALTAEQDKLLNEGLNQLEQRLKVMDAVFDRHRRWQNIHNALEDLDLCMENDFLRELEAFLKSNREEILSMLDDVTTVLSAVNQADLRDKSNKIKSLVCLGLDQLGERITSDYASMREAFDSLFYELDKATLTFVEQLEERIKQYEETLEELKNQILSRPVGAR
jgi:flagellar biosynthesis chaperone FliJ